MEDAMEKGEHWKGRALEKMDKTKTSGKASISRGLAARELTQKKKCQYRGCTGNLLFSEISSFLTISLNFFTL
jgi:hypothetical protein